MTNHTFDTITRRASVVTLGGAGATLAAAAASPDVGVAKKSVGKTCKKKAKKRCSSDAASCTAENTALCSGDPGCIAIVTACCAECSANGFITCVIASTASVTSAALGIAN